MLLTEFHGTRENILLSHDSGSHHAIVRTHKHYIRNEAAHAFVDGIRDKYMKEHRLVESEKTGSEALQVEDSSRNVHQTPSRGERKPSKL
jgi:hypothetical protein